MLERGGGGRGGGGGGGGGCHLNSLGHVRDSSLTLAILLTAEAGHIPESLGKPGIAAPIRPARSAEAPAQTWDLSHNEDNKNEMRQNGMMRPAPTSQRKRLSHVAPVAGRLLITSAGHLRNFYLLQTCSC